MFYLDFNDICNEWWIPGMETTSKKRQDGSQQDSGGLGPLAGSAIGLLGDLGQSVYPPLCLHLGSGNTDACQLCKLVRLWGRIGQKPGNLHCKEQQGPVFHFIYRKMERWDLWNSLTREQGSVQCRVGIWIFAFRPSYMCSWLLAF